ncbi:MAG: hypothetical protein AB2392_23170 [Neobacillus sp.]|jgi:hypothetical protein
MIFNDLFYSFKNWWVENEMSEQEFNQFERVESQHTRVRHDEDIREIIRVH